MKEIRTVKMVEQVEITFVANDGTEFVGENAEYECRNHERQCNEYNVSKEFNRLDKKEINIPFVEWFDDSTQIWKVTLYSKQDYLRLIDYGKVIIGTYADAFMEEPEVYPYTTTIVTGCEWANEYKGDIKEEFQKALEQLN